jgi:lysophospholipase L1-like esterase
VPLTPPGRARTTANVRIMPLGDSITDGHHAYPGGYRVALRQLLAADGHTVDFVGSLTNGPAELDSRNHEGHSGRRIHHLDAHIRTWLRHSAPHTVLLLIGTNDMNESDDAARAPERLARLIDHIREPRTTGDVFVGTIPPQSDPVQERRVRVYNAALTEVVAAKGPRVHLVTIHDALTTADLADDKHPSRAGHEKIARMWHEALRSVPTALRPPSPVPAPRRGLSAR